MTKRIFYLVTLLVLAFITMPRYTVAAQSATNAPWTSSITYYNPSDSSGTMTVQYFAEGSATAVDSQNRTLAPHAAGSIFIGTTNVPSGFQGSAVISSDVPVVATYVQFAGSGQSNEYARPLYSGFSVDKAAQNFFVPTLLYQKFGSSSLLGIQNIEGNAIDVTLKVYAAGATTPTVTRDYNIPAQSSQVIATSELGLPIGFTGSATIEPKSGGTAGRVVASVQETDDNGRGAYAFEGVASGSDTVYMPSMLCDAFGGQKSYYAIQNASLTSSATVTVEFYDTNGNLLATKPATTLAAGAKISVNPCNEGVPVGTSGSAVIKGASGDTLIAIGKVKAPNGMATAFTGESGGSNSVAAAYIRWAGDPFSEFRSYVAVMNIGNASATGCVANYYDAAGSKTSENLASIGVNLKVNTNPSTAGALDNGDFGTSRTSAGVGGALEITGCSQPVVVVVRMTKSVSLGTTTKFGEDYNAATITTP